VQTQTPRNAGEPRQVSIAQAPAPLAREGTPAAAHHQSEERDSTAPAPNFPSKNARPEELAIVTEQAHHFPFSQFLQHEGTKTQSDTKKT